METTKAQLKTAWPYQQDALNLPVANLNEALPFYETILGFQVESRNELPVNSAVLSRDAIRIGLAENGGDSSQDGCFFEVDNVEQAFAELKGRGLQKELSGFDFQKYGATNWKVFFVVAPDGLCYCYGERQNS